MFERPFQCDCKSLYLREMFTRLPIGLLVRMKECKQVAKQLNFFKNSNYSE